jgi:hypothetical protein
MLRETGQSATCNSDRSSWFAHYGNTIAAIRRVEARAFFPSQRWQHSARQAPSAPQEIKTPQPKRARPLR